MFFVARLLFLSLSNAANLFQLNIPTRLQWEENDGYCGEVSLISGGLYFGQYGSQFDTRVMACSPKLQNNCELLIGVNDVKTANQMHINSISWTKRNTTQFLAWVKKNVLAGYPVTIALFMNQFLFYNKTDPKAGDNEYDHIVPVIGISSKHPLNDTSYYADDVIIFSDNGLWMPPGGPPYIFNYTFGSFQANRKEANKPKAALYSLSRATHNYGLTMTGVKDVNGDCVPVRVDTNVNYEQPDIGKNSNTRPASMQLTLTITVSNLLRNVAYNLYRYNNVTQVPSSGFNGAANSASANWRIQIKSGTTYVRTDRIASNTYAIYRAVKASAP